MAATASPYSMLMLCSLWLLGLDINLFFLVVVTSLMGVNASCISLSSADYGVPFPTDSVSLPCAQSVQVDDIPQSRVSYWHSIRAVVPDTLEDDNPSSSSLGSTYIMTPFSIIPIIAYTTVALLLSYLVIRLLRRFNIRLLPAFLSASNERIPQPVTSTSSKRWGWGWVFPKGWNWSLNVFRRSFKGPNVTPTIKSRPRPADLDLQNVELLPVSSRAKEGQLVDLSSLSTASTITGVKLGVYSDSSNVGSGSAELSHLHYPQKDISEGRHLSRSSSVDAFPQFSIASTGFDTPVKSHSSPPTPPLTNTSSTSNYYSPFTPPSLSSYLYSPSPTVARLQVATSTKPALNSFKISGLGHSRSPSPSLSLSTSPLPGHRRSKSLGGVPLKRLGSSVKGKETQRDEILVDYSSSESSSLGSISNPPSSDVGMQRILPDPVTLTHSCSEGSYSYAPLVPLPVPLVDVPRSTSIFDNVVEDIRADVTEGKLIDIGNDETEMEEEMLYGAIQNEKHNTDMKLVDIRNDDVHESYNEKLVEVNEVETDDSALVLLASTTHKEDKLVDFEMETSEHISPVSSTPPRTPTRTDTEDFRLIDVSDSEGDDVEHLRAEQGPWKPPPTTPLQMPTRVETEEPGLVHVSDHEDNDTDPQQAEQDSWDWDEDPELNHWTEPANFSDLRSWNERGEHESVIQGEKADVPGTLPADPVEDENQISAIQFSDYTAETSSGLVAIDDKVTVSPIVIDSAISSPKVPTFNVTMGSPISPDTEIGVCLVPPTPMIHPIDDWDEDPLMQDMMDNPLNTEDIVTTSPKTDSEDISPITAINDIQDLDDTPTAPPVIELPPLTIPLITISSEIHQLEESEEIPDPDLLPLPEVPSVSHTNAQTSCDKDESPKEPLSQTPTPPASPPMPMSVVRSIPSSPRKERDNKPAWSLRASDAPSLGLVSAQSSPGLMTKNVLPKNELSVPSSVEDTSGPSSTAVEVSILLPGSFPESTVKASPESEVAVAIKQDSSETSVKGATEAASGDVVARPGLRRRTPRSPIDIALAMQLRPGLGVGADPAWMVRFLMTMFGWFAVLISGQGEF